MSKQRLLRIWLCCLLALAPRVVLASATFPPAVRDEWQLPVEPACTLCHQDLVGGFGTATKPFGRAVLRNGATAADTGALRRALRALEAAGSDVDHDGVSDIEELRMGADPDVFDDYGVDAGTGANPDANFVDDEGPLPQTGCSIAAVGSGRRGLISSARLTGLDPSPTVGPTMGTGSPLPAARRISGDAFLVCGLIFGALFVSLRRLRVQRKRMASAARQVQPALAAER